MTLAPHAKGRQSDPGQAYFGHGLLLGTGGLATIAHLVWCMFCFAAMDSWLALAGWTWVWLDVLGVELFWCLLGLAWLATVWLALVGWPFFGTLPCFGLLVVLCLPAFDLLGWPWVADLSSLGWVAGFS